MDVVLHHHEKVDGTGLSAPLGRRFDQCVCEKWPAYVDVYDAVTSKPSVQDGDGHPAEAVRKLAEWAPGHFEDRVFQAFVKSGRHLSGGERWVRLECGRLGRSGRAQRARALLKPTVKAFFSISSQSRIAPEMIDLAHPRNTPPDRRARGSGRLGPDPD